MEKLFYACILQQYLITMNVGIPNKYSSKYIELIKQPLLLELMIWLYIDSSPVVAVSVLVSGLSYTLNKPIYNMD